MDTSRTADIHSSCLLCLRRQRLQKIDISNTVAFLEYFDYILLVMLETVQTKLKQQKARYILYSGLLFFKTYKS